MSMKRRRKLSQLAQVMLRRSPRLRNSLKALTTKLIKVRAKKAKAPKPVSELEQAIRDAQPPTENLEAQDTNAAQPEMSAPSTQESSTLPEPPQPEDQPDEEMPEE